MRKSYTLILVLIVSFSLFGPIAIAEDNTQLANEGVIIKRDVYFMGDVGIGSTNPNAALHIKKDGRDADIILEADDGMGTELFLWPNLTGRNHRTPFTQMGRVVRFEVFIKFCV